MRVLVCGSRSWPEEGWHRWIITALLKGLYEEHHVGTGTVSLSSFVLIEGCARGADNVAHDWEENPLHDEPGKIHRDWGIPMYEHLHFPANWARHGKSAGVIRNQQMLDEGKPDVVYAFAYSGMTPGTRNMVELAKAADIPVFVTYG